MLPLTSGQRQLWAHRESRIEVDPFANCFLLTFDSPIAVDTILRRWAAIVQRNFYLRATVILHESSLAFVADENSGDTSVRADMPETCSTAADIAEWCLGHLLAEPLESSRMWNMWVLGTAEHARALVIRISHLVSDEWSLQLILDEFDDSMDRVPRPSLNRLSSAIEALRNEAVDHAVDLADALQTVPLLLEVPTDYPRPNRPSHRGATLRVAVPAELRQRLDARASELKVSGFTVDFAACAWVLALASRQHRLVVGCVSAGRFSALEMDVVGSFADVIPIPVEIGPRPSVGDFVTGIAGALREHTSRPAPDQEMLRRLLAVGPDLSHSPVFQAVVSESGLTARRIFVSGVGAEAYELRGPTAQYDLRFIVRADEVALEYAVDLFTEESSQRLLELVLKALDVLACAQVDVAMSPALLRSVTTYDRRGTSREWGAPDAIGPSVLQQFLTAAASYPNRIALQCSGGPLTYAELLRVSVNLGVQLREKGLTAGDRILLEFSSRGKIIPFILGAWLCGAAYIPILAGDPAARRDSIAMRTRARIRLTENAADEMLDKANNVDVSPSWSALLDVAHELGGDLEATSEIAYVLFTSGTTGGPKGVLVGHDCLARLCRPIQTTYGLGSYDVFSSVHSPAFDFSVWETWGALTCGATVVVLEEEQVNSPPKLIGELSRHCVSVLSATPTLLRTLTEESNASGLTVASIRLVISGGEQLSAPARFLAFAPTAQLTNLYGITEVTVHATVGRVLDEAQSHSLHPSAGPPLPDMTICIVDDAGHQLPDGVPGEIVVSGVGVAHGYLDDDTQTNMRFGLSQGERSYRSGDLGLVDWRGDLRVLGRIDSQMKVHGRRVEPAEIEDALLQAVGVRDAVVTLDTVDGRDVLSAYVAGQANQGMGPRELRALLMDKLPRYMVPRRYFAVPELPRTASGKLDMRALRAGATPMTEATSTRRREPGLGDAITAVFSRVLMIVPAPDDSFFDMGGDSIAAARIAREVSSLSSVKVTVTDIFGFDTVATLAAHISRRQSAASGG